MKRWVLSVGELAVGLAMLPEAVLFGALGTLPIIETLFAGKHIYEFRISQPTVQDVAYIWSVLVASFSVDMAALASLVSAMLVFRKPSRGGVRLAILGAVCFWLFVSANLVMGLTLRPRGEAWSRWLPIAADRIWLLSLLVAVASSLVAWGLHRHCITAQEDRGRAELCQVKGSGKKKSAEC